MAKQQEAEPIIITPDNLAIFKSKNSTCVKMDQQLHQKYYSYQHDMYGDNDDKKNENGNFLSFCFENDFDDDVLNESFDDQDDCMLVDPDFYNDFPFQKANMNDEQKETEIFEILSNIYKKCHIKPFTYLQKQSHFQLSNKELTKYRETFKKQASSFLYNGNVLSVDLLTVMSLGRKHGIPYLQFLTDAYGRARVNALKKNENVDYTTQHWRKNNDYLDIVDKAKQNQSSTLISSIESVHKRHVPRILFNSQHKIQDRLRDICKYIEQIVVFMQKMTNGSIGGYEYQESAPFQADFTFAFGKVNSTIAADSKYGDLFDSDDDSSDDDDGDGNEEKSNDRDDDDSFGDVLNKLNTHKLVNVIQMVNKDNDPLTLKKSRIFDDTFWQFKNKITKEPHYKQYKHKYPRKRRFLYLIDRRRLKAETDQVILFEPPRGCDALPNEHVPEWFLGATKECIIPGKEYKFGEIDEETICAASACGGKTLTLSFHVESADTVRCYLYIQGLMIRFQSSDLFEVLPKFFDRAFEDNEKFANSEEIKDIAQEIDIFNEGLFDSFCRLCN